MERAHFVLSKCEVWNPNFFWGIILSVNLEKLGKIVYNETQRNYTFNSFS